MINGDMEIQKGVAYGDSIICSFNLRHLRAVLAR